MASSFIGKSISLISHSDIRYRGTLQGIDPQASTIQLENVYHMGTETRRPQQYVPPQPEPYAYIVFRASEVKDLAVDDSGPPPLASVHDDPAVLGASPPVISNYTSYGNQQPQQVHGVRQPQPTPVAPSLPPVAAARENVQNVQNPPPSSRPQQQQPSRSRHNPISSANAAVEQVERAMSDLRVSNNTHRGGRGGRPRRGGRASDGGPDHDQMRVPQADYDFESANAKFDKSAAGKAAAKTSGDDSGTSDDAGGVAEAPARVAYNPKNSFFDEISSSASGADRGAGGGRGRRGGGGGGGPGSVGRTRREEEREKNIVTFGETGGVNMLSVGYTGYSRRVGGRPRRGTPRGGSVHAASARV